MNAFLSAALMTHKMTHLVQVPAGAAMGGGFQMMPAEVFGSGSQQAFVPGPMMMGMGYPMGMRPAMVKPVRRPITIQAPPDAQSAAGTSSTSMPPSCMSFYPVTVSRCASLWLQKAKLSWNLGWDCKAAVGGETLLNGPHCEDWVAQCCTAASTSCFWQCHIICRPHVEAGGRLYGGIHELGFCQIHCHMRSNSRRGATLCVASMICMLQKSKIWVMLSLAGAALCSPFHLGALVTLQICFHTCPGLYFGRLGVRMILLL